MEKEYGEQPLEKQDIINIILSALEKDGRVVSYAKYWADKALEIITIDGSLFRVVLHRGDSNDKITSLKRHSNQSAAKKFSQRH